MKRLGKQRVEIYQILRALHGGTKGWINHPATRMWSLYTNYLVEYGNSICSEWVHRGYKDTCWNKIVKYYLESHRRPYPYPSWLGDERFHSSHRAALLMKNPEWYSQFGWKEKPEIKYWWPGK